MAGIADQASAQLEQPGRSGGFGRLRWLTAALVAAASAVGGSEARADDVDSQIAAYEAEARQLGAELPRANQAPVIGGPQRLLDAQVSYALGDYDAAALTLFDLAARPGADQEIASFYLAEALFQKTDRGAARGYYEKIVANGSVASKYYQPSLERLIEISMGQNDEAGIAQWVASLDRISAGLRLPSVPYVRGKLAYWQGKLDDALAFFQDVPKGSDYELQAAYYVATVFVGKKDLPHATDLFAELVTRKPRTANDRRVIELSQLALGRLYYERDQPSKSIDAYLMVDRHSDVFPDALYEVGWVYVKNKQYDKALRALELLSQSDAQSTKTPTVRILEGNLRVRKAQMLRGQTIEGTLDNRVQDDPETEYDRAVQVFTETHDAYVPSYTALAQIVDGKADPAQYLTQIAGRWEHVFQAAAPLPEAAVQYLRDEPEVQRVVAIEGDLGEIKANLAQTEETIARLEGVVAAGDNTAVYPELASRRAHLGAIEDSLIKLRGQLAEQELQLVNPGAASSVRRQRVAEYAAMPSPEQAASARLAQREAEYEAVEDTVGEIEGAIGSTQAISVALRKYGNDTADLPGEQRRSVGPALDDAAKEAQAIEDELDGVRRELQIGRDLAVIDEGADATMRGVRQQLKVIEDAEHKQLVGLAATSRDPGKSQVLAAQAERASQLAEMISQIDHQVDGEIAQGLQDARTLLASANHDLVECQDALKASEAQAREFGATVLGQSFKSVKAKLYDIVIRTDVGNVDVAWSQKADTDDDLKRLNLSRQRDLKQLKDEFKDILDGGTQKPSAPSKFEMPRPEELPPSGSPDQGATDQRIAPTDSAAAAAPAAVKPDEAKAAKAKAAKQASANKASANKASANKASANKASAKPPATAPSPKGDAP
jgi:hypothetical protein